MLVILLLVCIWDCYMGLLYIAIYIATQSDNCFEDSLYLAVGAAIWQPVNVCQWIIGQSVGFSHL